MHFIESGMKADHCAKKRRASAMHRACPVCEASNQSMVSVRVVVVVMDAVTESVPVKVMV
jgi:hypothetical protein